MDKFRLLIITLIFTPLITLGGEMDKGLSLAWADEYKAIKTYESVISQFGEKRPFINIVKAERRHLSRVESVAQQLGVSLDKKIKFEPPKYKSFKAACEAGIESELENIKMYQVLLSNEKRKTVVELYKALSEASKNNHLPAFKRCGGNRS